jgi:adenosylcobinamide-GDP ribazoletransferase
MQVSFLVAWQLLTAIPLGRRDATLEQPGRSMAWFPLIGLAIGALLAASDFLLGKVWPPLPASALLLVVWVAITGGLHLDGFIDCCDGLLVAKSAEQRLEIMKDSRVGAFGVLGAVCLLLVKFASLVALPATARWSWLLVLPALSRWVMVWAAWRYPTARPDGFAVWFRQGLDWPHIVVAGGTALVAALALRGVSGLIGFVTTWIFALLFVLWVRRRIPGLTGDAYGALNELSEVVGLLLAIALGGIPTYSI